MCPVDLAQLALDRDQRSSRSVGDPRHLLTRYVLPALLLCSLLALITWASRDLLFPPTPVTVVPVLATASGDVQEGTPLFQAAGWIEPRPTPVRAAALAAGVVAKLLVVEDQPVEAGQPIAELVKDDATLSRDRAVADLQLRQAEVEEVQAALRAAITRLQQPVHLQSALATAEASLAKTDTILSSLPFEIRRAESVRQAARKDFEGKSDASGVVAAVEVDLARSAFESAEALVEELTNRANSLALEKAAMTRRKDAVQKQLELLADELQARQEAEARVKAATARVEQAQVAVAETELQLDRMTVRAPVDGRVFQLIGHPGARVGAGSSPTASHDASTVVTMYRPEMLQVRVDVRFEDLPKIQLGQPVQIANAALPSALTGSVLLISSEADIQKNTLQIKVAIPSPPRVLKPEMLVDVTFLAPKSSSRKAERSPRMRVYLPRRLIQEDDSGAFVWSADRSAGVARRTAIQIGAAGSGGLVEVTSGLTVTSRIVAGDTAGLEDGQRIRVTGENPAQESLKLDSEDVP